MIDLSKENKRIKNLTNQRFGRLIALYPDHWQQHKCGARAIIWMCKCDCGKETFVAGGHLTSGHTASCGCLSKENMKRLKEMSTKHGMSKTPEHNIWMKMISRCNDKKNNRFHIYGARGIKVCEKWMNSFSEFYKDIGPRPSKEHSIDRIDNDGDYAPGNVRWATRIEQANNKRNNTKITHNGKEYTIAMLARKIGISQYVISKRKRLGWPDEKIVNTKVRGMSVLYHHGGESHTMAEWARITGIDIGTLRSRKNLCGWSVEKMLTTPVKKSKKTKLAELVMPMPI